MKNKKIEEVVVEYLTCKDIPLKKVLREKLIELGYKLHELDDLSKLYDVLDNIETPEVSSRLNENFTRCLRAIHLNHNKSAIGIRD